MQVYYRGAVGAFVLFDVTESASFDAVQMWKEDIDTKVALPNDRPIPAVLLANKVLGLWNLCYVLLKHGTENYKLYTEAIVQESSMSS